MISLNISKGVRFILILLNRVYWKIDKLDSSKLLNQIIKVNLIFLNKSYPLGFDQSVTSGLLATVQLDFRPEFSISVASLQLELFY
jgi:hypothetical protein